MNASKVGIIIMAQGDALSDAQLRAEAERQLDGGPDAYVADVIRFTEKDHLQKLNACLESRLDEADRFVVLDASYLRGCALRAALHALQDAQADVLCGCAPALRGTGGKRTDAFVAYLCARGVLFAFGERAVQRMRTADTHDLVRETLSDRSVCVAQIPAEAWGGRRASAIGQKILLLRYVCTLRGALIAAAAAGALGTVVFLCVFLIDLCALRRWDVVSGVGCLICAHLFFYALGALMILWYRRSARREAQTREHPFRKETKRQ